MTSLAIATCALGGLKIVGSLGSLVAPDRARRAWQGFSRHQVAGWVLAAIDLFWVAWLILTTPPFSGMAKIAPMVYVGVPLIFFLVATFMDEMLAPRALGGLFLLLATPVLTAARDNLSYWSLFITLIAYVWVVVGMWIVVSPYRFRQFADYLSNDMQRFRRGNVTGLIVGVLLVTLGLAVY